MGGFYEVWLDTPEGVRLAEVSGVMLSLKYARAVNGAGSLVLTLPGTFDTTAIIAPDGRLEVWRQVPGGRLYLDTDTVWFIQAVQYDQDSDGERTITVEAQDAATYLLKEPGRFVDSYAGSSAATKTAAADDLIKAVVREQLGASASADRTLSAYLGVDADASAAPSVSKAFAWQPVLKVLQEVAQASAELGTYLAFDITAPTPTQLQFQTFTQQRGIDHRLSSGIAPVIVGPDMGNMGRATLRYDWGDEVSYAKAGGSGEGAGRITADYLDAARAAASPFRRREAFADATNTDTSAALTNAARSAVRDGRPRVILQGTLLDTPDTQYGVQWAWGDYLTVQMFGIQLDARVDAISVTVTPTTENIEAVIRSEQYQ